MLINESGPPRRKVIVSAGLGVVATVVAACSSGSKDSAATPASSAPAMSGGSSAPAMSGPSGVITTTADVPVGSAVIVDDVVVSQPTAGVFKGFSSVCTHAGCHVSKVTDGKILCPCHGSEFNLDGTVAKGPATKPLDAKPVTVQGDSIVAG